MIYGSVCSGIEAATVAWKSLGWAPAWFSEIEEFPGQLLGIRYPQIKNLGDMTKIYENQIFNESRIDLLVGGTPCQSFSITGLREGMADARGVLALEFLQIAKAKQTRWIVWENVPGVLSAQKGQAFGSFLGQMVEFGYGFAYRVLDAQNFGVPQRRRRVFVVGYLGNWRPAVAALFERESLCGNPTGSKEKWKETSETIETSFEECTIAISGCATPKISLEVNPTLRSGRQGYVFHKGLGRRLTPIEYERLQGFPDNYTNISGATDTARYKALGNSMAVPVMNWIGGRIQSVEDILSKHLTNEEAA
jgi:DNA (cytosine-5)-methyltransferase 1